MAKRSLRHMLSVIPLALALVTTAALPVAAEDHPFSVGLGFTLVEPANDNGRLDGLGRIEIGSSKRPTLIFAYRPAPRWAIEAMIGYPFKHTVGISGAGAIATVRQLPVALTLQHHFDAGRRVVPFVGAGLGYIHPFDAFPRNALRDRRLDFDDDLGVVLQAGIDLKLASRQAVRLDLRYFDIDFATRLDGRALGDTSVNPVFYSLSYLYRF